MSFLVMIPVLALFELVTRVSATLRPCRRQLRILLAMFWTVVLVAYYGSRLGWIPARLHYGDGMFRFASDSLTYREQAAKIAEALRAGSLPGFFDPDNFFYSKMLGILYVVFGTDPLVGMLFNAVFYMTVLISVFVLARTLFDERTGVVAVWIVGMWPTFVLHQTQTIRWVATSAAICAMMTAAVLILGNGRMWRVLAVAAVSYPILLYDVPYMARLLYMGLFGFAAILLGLGLRWRRYPTRALRTAALGVVLFVAYQAVWAAPPAPRAPDLAASGELRTPSYVERLVDHVLRERRSSMREDLRGYATNFDDAPTLNGLGDIILNAPAAYSAALLAPYPRMLLGGPEGISGVRRYAFAEMVVYYALLPFVVVGIALTLRRPRFFLRVQALFVTFCILGIYGLMGTVVTNAGTLQRLRLPYVLMQFAFAAGALRVLFLRHPAEPPPTLELREETWHPIAEVALPERG